MSVVPPEGTVPAEPDLLTPREPTERFPLFWPLMAVEGLGTTGVDVALEGATRDGPPAGREWAGRLPIPMAINKANAAERVKDLLIVRD